MQRLRRQVRWNKEHILGICLSDTRCWIPVFCWKSVVNVLHRILSSKVVGLTLTNKHLNLGLYGCPVRCPISGAFRLEDAEASHTALPKRLVYNLLVSNFSLRLSGANAHSGMLPAIQLLSNS